MQTEWQTVYYDPDQTAPLGPDQTAPLRKGNQLNKMLICICFSRYL